MTLRSYLEQLIRSGEMLTIDTPVSTTYEMAGILKKLEPRPVLFENVNESSFRVMGNLFSSKSAFASYFSLQVKEIIPALSRAIESRTPCPVVASAPCQEVVIDPARPGCPADPAPLCPGWRQLHQLRGVHHPPSKIWPEPGFPSCHAVFKDRDGCPGGARAPLPPVFGGTGQPGCGCVYRCTPAGPGSCRHLRGAGRR